MLIAAIAMPITIACLFLVASTLPRIFVADPQYDLLISIDSHTLPHRPYRVAYSVKNDQLVAHLLTEGIEHYYYSGQLYRLNTKTGRIAHLDSPSMESLAAQFNAQSDVPIQQQIALPSDLEALTLIPGDTAPDGYEFRHGYRRGPGLVGDIFGMSHRRSNMLIEKKGRIVSFNDESHGAYHNVAILGWVKQ